MSRAIQPATAISSAPTSSDATGSQNGCPVSWCRAIPPAAIAMPASAAVSSNSTIFTLGSRLSRTYRRSGLPAARASARVWWSARSHDAPSAATAIASVIQATRKPPALSDPATSSMTP